MCKRSNMDLLRKHLDFISSYVAAEDILDKLLEDNLLSLEDYGKLWVEREEEYDDQDDKNKRMYSSLLEMLADYQDDQSSIYGICDFIAENYPAIAINIPMIAMRVRMREPISNDKLVTLFKSRYSMVVDIRKMQVSLYSV